MRILDTVYSVCEKANKDLDYIFYDFECFMYDWMVVLYSEKKQRSICIRNDRLSLCRYFREHRRDIWVGYNSHAYDEPLMKGILLGINPKKVSDYIIKQDKPGWGYDARFRDIQIIGYDVMNDCREIGLKTIEGSIGSDIRETEVDFDLDRHLTKEELDRTEIYCRHDVEQTRKIFLINRHEFDANMSLIEAFDLDPRQSIGRTQQQLVSVILGAVKQQYNDEWDIRLPRTLRLETEPYKAVARWFLDPSNHSEDSSVTAVLAGVKHSFGWGGAHGARTSMKDCEGRTIRGFHIRNKGLILDNDGRSYYPTLMIQYHLLSRSVQNPEKFKTIYEKRLQYKKANHPFAKPYKIVINATYGAMRMKSSRLYDPLNGKLVCVFGQLLIIDLIEKLELAHINGFQLIQTNTDGIMYTVADEKAQMQAELVASEWEERVHVPLDTEKFDEIWQRDVSNYYIIGTDDKGGLTERAKGSLLGDVYPKSNNLRIISKSMREYFLHNTPVRDTIAKDDYLIDYQQVSKVRQPCDLWVHKTKSGIEKIDGKVNRMFASCRADDGTFAFAKSKDIMMDIHGNRTVAKTYKAGGIPEHAFCIRGDVSHLGRHTQDGRIDLEWYAQETEKHLSEFGCTVNDLTADNKSRKNPMCTLADYM